MTLTSLGTTSAPAARSASSKPVIDIDAIRSILYLGVKGEIMLGRAGQRTSTRSLALASGRGVDTYA